MCRLSVVLALAVVLTACALHGTQPPPDLPAFSLWGPWAPPLAGHAARQSTWDQTGANSDAIRLEPGETATLLDASGSGIIRRIWITTNASGPVGRTLVLRMFWDGAATPAVEAPLGDFYGVSNGMAVDVNSLPITVTSRGRSRNAWWPMPFRDGARITLTNEGPVTHSAVYCHVDYLALDAPPPTRERFHAQYRQAHPASGGENYVILEASGRGHYMGTVFGVESTEPQWWGEGDELIEADGREPLRGTGTEEHFGDAWGTRPNSFLWHGTPVCEGFEIAGQRTSMYRFHIPDPIPFEEHIRVSIEHGTQNDRADNLSSLAIWYQDPPAAPFPPLPSMIARLTGEDRDDAVRLCAWQLATSGAATSEAEIEALHPHADEDNQLLLHGLAAYARGREAGETLALHELDGALEVISRRIEAMPESERWTAPAIDVPTDPDALVPSLPVRVQMDLQRARHDLARRIALARGHLVASDEIIVESRDPMAQLTEPPAFESAADWTYSYAKVADTRLMGTGSHFTYGSDAPTWARFTPELPQAGRYEVLVIFSYGANAEDTRCVVRHAEGETTVDLPQRGRPGTEGRNCDIWHSLGTFEFNAGQDAEHGSVTLVAGPGDALSNTQFEYRAYADAVRFIFRGE